MGKVNSVCEVQRDNIDLLSVTDGLCLLFLLPFGSERIFKETILLNET